MSNSPRQAYRVLAACWDDTLPLDPHDLLTTVVTVSASEAAARVAARRIKSIKSADARAILSCLCRFSNGLTELDLSSACTALDIKATTCQAAINDLRRRSLIEVRLTASRDGRTSSLKHLYVMPDMRAAILACEQNLACWAPSGTMLNDRLDAAVTSHLLTEAMTCAEAPWEAGNGQKGWLLSEFQSIQEAIRLEIDSDDQSRQKRGIKAAWTLAEFMRMNSVGSPRILVDAANKAMILAEAGDHVCLEAAARCLRGAAWLWAWSAPRDPMSDAIREANRAVDTAECLYASDGPGITETERLRGQASCRRTRAMIYRREHPQDPGRAQKELRLALEQLASAGPELKPMLWNCKMDLGDLHFQYQELSDAARLFEEVIRDAQSLHDITQSHAQYELGAAKKRLGDVYMEEGNLDSAFECYDEAKIHYDAVVSERGSAICELRKAELYIRESEDRKAEKLLDLAEPKLVRTRAFSGQNLCQILRGYASIHRDPQKAAEWFAIGDRRAADVDNTFHRMLARHGTLLLSLGTLDEDEARSAVDELFERRCGKRLKPQEARIGGFEYLGLLQLTPATNPEVLRERDRLLSEVMRCWKPLNDQGLNGIIERYEQQS